MQQHKNATVQEKLT